MFGEQCGAHINELDALLCARIGGDQFIGPLYGWRNGPARGRRLDGNEVDPRVGNLRVNERDKPAEILRDGFRGFESARRMIIVTCIQDHGAWAVGNYNSPGVSIHVRDLSAAKAAIEDYEGLQVVGERTPQRDAGAAGKDDGPRIRRMDAIAFLEPTNRGFPGFYLTVGPEHAGADSSAQNKERQGNERSLLHGVRASQSG